MLDDQLQMIKLFIMNRIIPKCKLKDICDQLQISIKLTSMNTFMISRTETFGNKTHKPYHLGLIDEHYFIVEKTNMTSYCLNHYDDVKHIDNCNMIFCKFSDKYKTSNKEYIDSFKVVKPLIENKDKLLNNIPFDEQIMNTQFYDKVTEYKTLDYPESCIDYQTYKQKEQTKYYKVYFDFKTETSKIHSPYLVRYETEDGERRLFMGEKLRP